MRRRGPRPDPEGDARAAELERLLAEVPPSDPAPAAPPDVAALVAAELDRRARAEADAVAEAEFAMGRCPSGACACCGIEAVVAVDLEGRRSPGWRINPDGPDHVCLLCWVDLFADAWYATRDDRRVGAIRMLLDGPPIPLVALGNPAAFEGVPVWWREFPGAPPVQTRETAAELLGVHEVAYGDPVIPGLAKRAGFRWFYETGGDRQGRRRPSAELWAHLDIERMRRRAGLTQAIG